MREIKKLWRLYLKRSNKIFEIGSLILARSRFFSKPQHSCATPKSILLQTQSSVDFVLFAPIHTCWRAAMLLLLLLPIHTQCSRRGGKTKPPVPVRVWWERMCRKQKFSSDCAYKSGSLAQWGISFASIFKISGSK